MAIQDFNGHVLCEIPAILGEGPTYDVTTDTAWWFDIKGKVLHELSLGDGTKRAHALPFLASAMARIDDRRQLIASEDGLFIRDIETGALTLHVPLEADNAGTRSNDGRMHQSGALWIGTMGKQGEDAAGAIYHVAGSTVTRLYDKVSIPNAICFSPDGKTGYFADSADNRLMTVDLDPATGLPLGAPRVLVDGKGRDGAFDGAVCDAEGHIWNARWGEGTVDRYDPSGQLVSRMAVPASQVTCPAFIGRDLDRLLLTSASDGLENATSSDGQTFELGVTVRGRAEPSFRLSAA